MRLRALILSLHIDGLQASTRRAWIRLFGAEHYCVFVRHLKSPAKPVQCPVETKGLVVRRLGPSDLRNIYLQRYEPPDADRLGEAFVATRQDQIVGAAWYTDSVNAERPWYRAVEPHLIEPALLTSNIFVVPGDKGAAWGLAHTASEVLATTGVHSIVGVVGAQNNRSILMSRLLGAKMVARMTVRHWFGRTTTVVDPTTEDRGAAIAPSAKTGPAHRRTPS